MGVGPVKCHAPGGRLFVSVVNHKSIRGASVRTLLIVFFSSNQHEDLEYVTLFSYLVYESKFLCNYPK